jgi:hypothetical protein
LNIIYYCKCIKHKFRKIHSFLYSSSFETVAVQRRDCLWVQSYLNFSFYANEWAKICCVFVYFVFQSFQTKFVTLFETCPVFVENESGLFFFDDEENPDHIAVLYKASVILVWWIFSNLFLIVLFYFFVGPEFFFVRKVNLFTPDRIKSPQLKVVFRMWRLLIFETDSNEKGVLIFGGAQLINLNLPIVNAWSELWVA